jgi:hypothetical protein
MVEERFHRDTEGRPIREGRTPRELLNEGEIEYKQCPYSGSRYLHANPMNVSALRQTSAHWDEVVDAVAFLRSAYGDARGGYRFDLMDVWRTSQIGSSLPWFYILHQHATCPAYAAALSKATLGVGIWGARVLVQAISERKVYERITPQLILETSEENGTLIADSEVCAAGDKMMLKFYEPFCEAVPCTGLGDVGPLVAAAPAVLRFGAHYVAFKQWIWMYWLARRFLYEEVGSVVGPRPDLVELLHLDAEPPDFFLLQPAERVELPLAQRQQWFAMLGMLIEPFAPDGSDAPHRAHAVALAEIMGREPERMADLAAEVARVTGYAAAQAERIARAIGTYAALDAAFADVLATTELGIGGATGAEFTADMRDRVLNLPPRPLFAAFAPETFAAISRR